MRDTQSGSKQRVTTLARQSAHVKRWATSGGENTSGKGSRTIKTPSNSGKAWTPAQNQQLRQLAKGNTPTRVAALKLGRTPGAVQNHAQQIGVSLKPTNQSPYGTQK